jgi:N-acetylmuramoyl-L-alanine amidase
MSRFSARHLPLLTIAILLLATVSYFILRKPPTPPPVVAPAPAVVVPVPTVSLSMLAELPDWPKLDAFQETITREEFERLLTTVFTTGEAWTNFIEIAENEARIQTGNPSPDDPFLLRFARAESTQPTPRLWKTTAELPPAPPDRPLADLHIAIDPGHIGGDWAKMEERWFIVGDGKSVCEGDMTLYVAKLLKPRLEALGATVSLVRDKPEPITPVRPDALRTLAQDSATVSNPDSIQKLAERLFYRTAEIRARAHLVNHSIKPDLVLCLHFNAEAWGDPNNPTLIGRTHLHLLLNGGYNDEEVSLADQRFALLQKLLQRSHDEEVLVGSTVAATFAEISGLPPYRYDPNSKNVRRIPDQPFLWARNLLANRLYDCPVIFMEPYVMNSTLDYARIQAGDYEGLQEFGGKMLPSIFQEYTGALVEGLTRHYRASRRIAER